MNRDGRLNFDIAEGIGVKQGQAATKGSEERFQVCNPTVIKVVGVGGGGNNTLNTMIERGVEGVEFIAINTDVQALARNKAPTRIQIGDRITGGRGVGGKPENGRNAANEDKAKIEEALMGANLVFVCTGLGGGTGTGAAPVVAKVAREVGALVIAVVTRPFSFEGNVRQRNAEQGILELTDAVDARIVIPNDRLLHLVEETTSLDEAFGLVDGVLYNGVKSISDLIVGVGRINVDFEDLKTIMSERGKALMGLGYATGEKRALRAAEMAIKSPLIEDNSIEGATGILLNFTGGKDLGLMEVVEAANLIRESASENANIIFGVVTDPALKDEVQVTVIATGFDRVVAESYDHDVAELPEPEVIEAPAPQSYVRPQDDMSARNGGMGGWFGTKRWNSRTGSALVNNVPNRYSVSEYSTSGNDKRRYRRISDDWMQD